MTPPADQPRPSAPSVRGAVRSHAPGLLVLLAFFLAGEAVSSFARLPLPGSVAGMLLLAAALRLRWVPESLVRPAADFLLRHMALLFVPPGVGLILHLGLLRREWVPIAIASAVSVVAVLLCVGWLQQRLGARG